MAWSGAGGRRWKACPEELILYHQTQPLHPHADWQVCCILPILPVFYLPLKFYIFCVSCLMSFLSLWMGLLLLLNFLKSLPLVTIYLSPCYPSAQTTTHGFIYMWTTFDYFFSPFFFYEHYLWPMNSFWIFPHESPIIWTIFWIGMSSNSTYLK